jgi:multiple sugar transport system ATP-binding protein
MAEVDFAGVTKRFGDVVAVDDLTLEVADDEFMVLLGPSGCGKTTTLRMVAGLDTITAGTLSIGGRVVNDVEAKDRDVSMVFQSYALYPHMTVARNIESPLVARTFVVDGESERRKLHKAERAPGAPGRRDLAGSTCSAASRRPVGVGSSVASPGVVSRPARSWTSCRTLTPLAQTRSASSTPPQLATTFIYVTHDQVEAATRRRASPSWRRPPATGRPPVRLRPAHNLFVACLIGSPPEHGAGHRRPRRRRALGRPRRAGLRLLHLPARAAGRRHHRRIGVRPEHLFLESPTPRIAASPPSRVRPRAPHHL